MADVETENGPDHQQHQQSVKSSAHDAGEHLENAKALFLEIGVETGKSLIKLAADFGCVVEIMKHLRKIRDLTDHFRRSGAMLDLRSPAQQLALQVRRTAG